VPDPGSGPHRHPAGRGRPATGPDATGLRAAGPRGGPPRDPAGPDRRWRAFRLLALTQATHAAGDVLVAVALADTLFFSVPLGEARGKVALYLGLTMAPLAVLAPLVGPWLDRRKGSYRAAIIISMAARVLLAVLLSSRTDRLLLYPLAFGLLVLSRVHAVSRAALVPEVTPPGRTLLWANGRLAVVAVLGGTLAAGPALGLNHLLGPAGPLWAAALVFAGGAVAAARLPLAEGAGQRRPDRPVLYRQLLSSRLAAGGVVMATLRAAVGFTTFLLAFLLRAEGAGGRGLAVVIVAAAVGGIAGTVVAPALRTTFSEPLLLLVALLVVGLAAVWTASSFGLLSAAVLAAVVGLAAAAGRLAFDSLLQSDAPEHVRGRSFARYETTFQLCWVAGAGLAAALPFQPASGLATLAGLCVAGLAISARGLLRRRRAIARRGTPPRSEREWAVRGVLRREAALRRVPPPSEPDRPDQPG
jgi:Major Facilitator Superfamily